MVFGFTGAAVPTLLSASGTTGPCNIDTCPIGCCEGDVCLNPDAQAVSACGLDTNNCRNCNSTGPTSAIATCHLGNCNYSCPTGDVMCGMGCVSVEADNNNCGQCGHVCTGGTACSCGSCVVPGSGSSSGTPCGGSSSGGSLGGARAARPAIIEERDSRNRCF